MLEEAGAQRGSFEEACMQRGLLDKACMQQGGGSKEASAQEEVAWEKLCERMEAVGKAAR